MAGIAIIGYGYWGANLVRNFSAVTGCSVEWVVDLRTERLALIKKQYPNIHITSNELLTVLSEDNWIELLNSVISITIVTRQVCEINAFGIILM